MSFNIEARLRAGVRVALGGLLLAPYLIWLIRIENWSWPPLATWIWPLMLAGLQALFSASFAMLGGFVLFRAAQGWTGKSARQSAEFALLLPNVVPPLFLVLALLSWVTPWHAFPFGFWAVVAAHVLLNAGLAAVALDRMTHAKLGAASEAAWAMGVTPARFWRRVAWPILRADIFCTFLFIFSICLTSFSIPLILGGPRETTLEVAIYDVIRLEGAWDKAVFMAVCQSLLLFGLAWSLPTRFFPRRPVRQPLTYFAWPRLRAFVYVPALILVLGWAIGLNPAHANLRDIPFVEAILTTMILGLTVGVLHLVLFLLTAYVMPNERLERFLNGYLAPSPVITGFAFLLIPLDGGFLNLAKLTLALTLISFPLLYRWLAHAALRGLGGQIQVARVLGADWRRILFTVVWPQTGAVLLRASGLAAVWAAGDFAVSGLVGGGIHTLPLLMQDLIGNYRIEDAQLLMIPLAIASALLYFLFNGASRYVAR